jgi:hypothetical protein
VIEIEEPEEGLRFNKTPLLTKNKPCFGDSPRRRCFSAADTAVAMALIRLVEIDEGFTDIEIKIIFG